MHTHTRQMAFKTYSRAQFKRRYFAHAPLSSLATLRAFPTGHDNSKTPPIQSQHRSLAHPPCTPVPGKRFHGFDQGGPSWHAFTHAINTLTACLDASSAKPCRVFVVPVWKRPAECSRCWWLHTHAQLFCKRVVSCCSYFSYVTVVRTSKPAVWALVVLCRNQHFFGVG